MANPANQANQFETLELVPRPKPSRAGLVGWLLLVVVVAGTAAFVKFVHLPLRDEEARLRAQLGEAAEREKQYKKKLADTEARVAALEAAGQELSGKLAQTEAEKERLEAELKRVQSELQSLLEPQISAGNVNIKRRGNELVLDLAAQILFDSGRAEINEEGQKVLAGVVKSLATLRNYTIQVGGHTDQQRVTNPETKERFPTNWELSTARATNVVRFLEEKGKIPGSRLVAAGYSQYRPVASNATEETRKKNRRIEIVLLPALKK